MTVPIVPYSLTHLNTKDSAHIVVQVETVQSLLVCMWPVSRTWIKSNPTFPSDKLRNLPFSLVWLVGYTSVSGCRTKMTLIWILSL